MEQAPSLPQLVFWHLCKSFAFTPHTPWSQPQESAQFERTKLVVDHAVTTIFSIGFHFYKTRWDHIKVRKNREPQPWDRVSHPCSEKQPLCAARGRQPQVHTPHKPPCAGPSLCLKSPLTAHSFLHYSFQFILAKRSVHKIHCPVENVAQSYSRLVFLHKEPDTFER